MLLVSYINCLLIIHLMFVTVFRCSNNYISFLNVYPCVYVHTIYFQHSQAIRYGFRRDINQNLHDIKTKLMQRMKQNIVNKGQNVKFWRTKNCNDYNVIQDHHANNNVNVKFIWNISRIKFNILLYITMQMTNNAIFL